MKLIKILILLSLSICFSVYANNFKIKDVNYKKLSNNLIQLKINLNQEYDILPTLSLKKNIIQLVMPEASVWPTIKKKVKLGDKHASISAYQYNKNVARVRFLLPQNALYLKGKIKVDILSKSIVLKIPYSFKTLVSARLSKKIDSKNDGLKYDESYLNQLLRSDDLVKKNKNKTKDHSTNSIVSNKYKKDIISFKSSAIQKSSKPKFSAMKYIGKFVAFLAVILLGFYGVVYALKKGALSKTKLGFLNSTKVVEVLSNTYVGPKKNLMLVRAHNQVFLVGSSEHSLQLISEVKDTAGIIKNGEKEVAGSNFDTNFDTANILKKDFKLKEVIEKSTPVNLKESKASRFKEELKEKVRNLKSMQ